MSTDHVFTSFHGEAARRYLERCRLAGDQRSPLELLSDLLDPDRALQLWSVMFAAALRSATPTRFPFAKDWGEV